jgi:pimeloyl-ACP methyl ester carboxylesterase
MNSATLKSILLPLACLLALSALSALSSTPAAQGAEPVLSLSQDQWVGAKKEMALPTGLTMKYVDMGQPSGPPLVLIHGMTDNSRSGSPIAPFLSGERRLIIVDLRGHGGSGKPDLRMYPVSLYAADVAALLDGLGIEKASVVGHSLGSMVAQALAINYPEKVDKVVLESSALVAFDSLGRDIYDAALGFGENPPDDEFMEGWYSNPNPVDQDFLRREMAESKGLPPHAWRAIAKGAAASDLTHFMDELKAPTLILWGSADGFFGAEAQALLKKALPSAASIDYEGTGHNIHWEIPQKMAADVAAFLAK